MLKGYYRVLLAATFAIVLSSAALGDTTDKSYPWSVPQREAEQDIKNGKASDAEPKLRQALELADKDLSDNKKVDASKEASLKNLMLDFATWQRMINKSLPELVK